MSKTGTMTLADLRANRFQSVAAFGLDTITEVFQRDLAVHNGLVAGMLGQYCSLTADRQRIYGTSGNTDMIQADEFSRAPTQKVLTGQTLGFPFRKFAYAVGWTFDSLNVRTVGEVADQLAAAKKAHLKMVQRRFKRALYTPTNSTFFDELVLPQLNLDVKAFLNADGADIPEGPNGEAFDGSTHTHYTAEASLTAAGLKASIATVIEHGHGGQLVTVIAASNEATVKALSGFTPLEDPRLILGTNDDAADRRLDITRVNDRLIGYFEQSLVVTKPWAIAGYAVTADLADPIKPLVCRTRDGGAPAMRMVATMPNFPLLCEQMAAEFDFGVQNRSNGAVHQFTNGTYQTPTF